MAWRFLSHSDAIGRSFADLAGKRQYRDGSSGAFRRGVGFRIAHREAITFRIAGGGVPMTRFALFAGVTSIALLCGAGPSAGQALGDYPNRPIRIIVPQAAGSGVDLQARVLAQKMGGLWGQQGIVENRPGANAIVGMEAAAKAAPDGYTLVYAPVSSVTTNQLIYKKLPYDPVRDFTPITQTAANPMGAVANPASGIRSIKDVIERAKQRPGELNYGSFGIGNLTHLMGELLQIAAGISMTHVPYKGQTPAITDVLAGQIPLAFTTMAGATDLVQSGKLNLIATFGGARDEQFPDTPTVVEAGYPAVVVVGWSGLLAPAGVPPHIISRLHSGFVRALAMPDVKDAILRQGSRAVSSSSPEEFARYIQAETQKFRPVIKAAGLEGSQ
jgi:tripartite-type tricarboxylate transporter receptor subunit TctC